MTKAASASRHNEIESLRSSREFSRVMRTGVRTKSGPVTVVRLESVAGGVRCGIVTGSHLGNAVVRNRIKRRIREAARRANFESASDYVIVPNHRAATARFAELVTAIEMGARSQKRET